LPEFPDFEDYLSTLDKESPLNLWRSTEPDSLYLMINKIRSEFKMFEYGKTRYRIDSINSPCEEKEVFHDFKQFIERLDASKLMKTCEYYRQDRSDNATLNRQSKKKNQLQIGGEIYLDIPKDINSMEAEECKLFIKFVLDITTMKITNTKFIPDGGLTNLMLRKDKYFDEDEDILGIPPFPDEMSIFDHISEVKIVVDDFIRQIVDKYNARKSLMWKMLPEEFGFKSLRYIDMTDFHDCTLYVNVEDEGLQAPDNKSQVFLELVCGPNFPKKFPVITISARKDDGHSKSLKPTSIDKLGNLNCLDDIITTLKSLIREIVKVVMSTK